MPKIRTHKSAAKRFRFTSTGKVVGRRTHKSHLLTHKSATRKRRLSRPRQITGGDAARIKRMLPYHGT
ncbi:MAG: 50S ribosomal protein L35 [Armatimonadota bacterium]|nr:MAG: 50S ribosomal protein L35 [Armatimonadota bacterium]